MQIVVALTENQVGWIRNKIMDVINCTITDNQRQFLVTLDDQLEQSLMDAWVNEEDNDQ